MRKKPQIAVLGSINMDLVARCPHLPVAGQTTIASSFREVCGGKGANQAVAAARLGADVALIGRVGDDALATRLRQSLVHERIDASHVAVTESCSSGIALVTVEESGENAIVVVPGANGRLTDQDVRAAAAVIRNSDVLMLQLEVPIEAVLAAINIARQADVRVVLDPAPAPSHYPLELFDVEVICPNQSEAAAVVGHGIQSLTDAKLAATQLCERGVKYSIVTLGAQGAVASDGERATWFEPFKIEPVDTTAAGDAFAAAFAVRWIERESLRDAVHFAAAAGAITASRAGAQTAMPTHAEVESLLAVGNVRVGN